MIARIRKSMDEKDQGFTLIELLVVIIIIGILAAIAIPVFLNQRKKAVDASMKSDLRTVATGSRPTTRTTRTTTRPAGSAGTITIGAARHRDGPERGQHASRSRSSRTDSYCIKGVNPKGTDTPTVLLREQGRRPAAQGHRVLHPLISEQ